VSLGRGSMLGKRPVKNVLLIESDPQEVRRIGEMFSDQGSYSFKLARSVCMANAETYLAVHPVEVILLDLALLDSSELDRLLSTHVARHASIVLLCEPKDEAAAARAMEAGVQDYLFKSQMEPHELMRAMRNSVARKLLEEALFHERNRAQVTLECIGDAVICTDDTGNITFLNPIAERMTGWSLKESVNQPLAHAFRITDASTGEIAADPTLKAIGRGRTNHLPLNCILTRRDGLQLFIEDSVAPIRDRDGQASGSVLVFRDVTTARALAEQIAHLAEHDSLTGLPNRLLLNDRLNHAIAAASRSASMMAILFLDLDGFKHINDSLGHSAGDRLLKSVAERLQHCIRTPDTVSRQGGDEFVVLLTDVRHAEDAAATAGRMLKSVMEPHEVDSSELHVTASIGISIYPDDGVNAETLLKNADAAMYQAKESGRHSYRFFKPEMNIRAVERQSIEQDLRRALERKELTIEYQPILNLKSGTITGAEALLRWTHPLRGSVAPSVFIPVAEDSGLIVPIGAWVMREACTQARTWTSAGLRSITMSVNVSALQFRSESFLASITRTLEETGLSPGSLNIEVTESALMERARLGAPILTALRGNGVQVSVDDFGTGYSSLSYLQKLPVDALKIDQSFVRQISSAAENTTIVSAIISMGRSLRLKVIGEGVESEPEMTFLKEHNCDEAQGFFFGRPMTAEKFARLESMQVN
jgi:diguanylate cyclase (GGDEF)-like protein/PAS domain S-box-containing protein